MAEYRLGLDGSIIRIADGAVIPADPNNADYAAYLAWADEPDNTPDPAPDPPEPIADALAESVAIALPALTSEPGLSAATKTKLGAVFAALLAERGAGST